MFYLYMWMAVAAWGDGASTSLRDRAVYGWVNQGEYRSVESCNAAAKTLEVKIHRCVPNGKKAPSVY